MMFKTFLTLFLALFLSIGLVSASLDISALLKAQSVVKADKDLTLQEKTAKDIKVTSIVSSYNDYISKTSKTGIIDASKVVVLKELKIGQFTFTLLTINGKEYTMISTKG